MPFSYYTEGAYPERAALPSTFFPSFSLSPLSAGIESRAPAGLRLLSPDSPELYYVGRFPVAHRAAPRFAWQGSELLARFTGRRLGFRFNAPTVGPVFFNVIVDGANRVLELSEKGKCDYLLEAELGAGEHELVLYKRTEAFIGTARLLGLLVEEGSSLGPRPEALPLRIEFYGDSITAGACNEDPGDDQYDDQSTHDNYLSYGSIACRSLGAEYVSIAVSGTGICESWTPLLMDAIWNKASVDFSGGVCEAWDFSGRKPEIVVINLGENDHGLPFSEGRPFPPDFAHRYEAFVRRLRAAYPEASIICAIGGMSAWRESAPLRAAWEKAVAALESSDDRVYDLRFKAFSCNHPRVALHLELASELEDFIRERKLNLPRPASSSGVGLQP
jgi:hypothetical protein